MEKVFQYLNDLLYDTDGAQWSDLCDEFLLYGVPAILAIVAGCLAVWLVILIRQWILRVKVGRRYGVTVPENIHISRSDRQTRQPQPCMARMAYREKGWHQGPAYERPPYHPQQVMAPDRRLGDVVQRSGKPVWIGGRSKGRARGHHAVRRGRT